MGFRKPIDLQDVIYKIHKAYSELSSPYNDGFNQWMIKQDLYKIKWLIDEVLEKSPKFSGEEEFVEKHEKEVVWQTLKK